MKSRELNNIYVYNRQFLFRTIDYFYFEQLTIFFQAIDNFYLEQSTIIISKTDNFYFEQSNLLIGVELFHVEVNLEKVWIKYYRVAPLSFFLIDRPIKTRQGDNLMKELTQKGEGKEGGRVG